MNHGFAVTVNGRVTTVLKSHSGGPLGDELNRRLDLLNGIERFALSLWKMPSGVPLDRVDFDVYSAEYVQCAGGLCDRFVCEVRRIDERGRVQHSVLGRAVDPTHPDNRDDETVSWGEHQSVVRASEVLSIDDIRKIFAAYLLSGEVPAEYSKRPGPA